MWAKTLPILFLLFVLIGCQAEKPASVSSGDATTFEPDFDTPPEVADLFPPDIPEDTQSGFIYLSFTDADNDTPSSCQIFNRTYVNVSTPCTCAFGYCYVRVTPFTNYNGAVSFQYSVTANGMTSQGANVSFNVTALSDAPVANDRVISFIENTTYTSDGTISYPHLSGSDPDGNPVTCSLVTDANNLSEGSATVNADCSFSFTPVADYEGQASFTFKVNDGTTDSSPATVTVNVLHLNALPVASDVTLTTHQNIAGDIIPVFTDADPSDPWEMAVVSNPTKGTLSGTGLNRTYTPFSDYIGTDSFTFKVFDGEGHSNLVTANITVLPRTIYLRATGNDATGVISDPDYPFLTAQAAADAASAVGPTATQPVTIDVGSGNFGNMSFNYNFGEHITWKGAGAGVSIIGDITGDGANGADGDPMGDISVGEWDGEDGFNALNLTISSDFTVTFGNVSANGGNGGAHVPDNPNGTTLPGDPGTGGILDLKGIFGTITAKGGNGNGGGAGGNLRLRAGSTSLDVDLSGGLDMCTTPSWCATDQPSGNGGVVQVDSTAVVTGNIVAKGGENLGNDIVDVYLAGSGGTIKVYGTVNGNIIANGGDSMDAQVGEGGSVDIKSTGIVSGDVTVLNGVASGSGDPNFAGYVEVSGTVQDIYAHGIDGFGGGGAEIVVRGTARDIFAYTNVLSCDISAAGTVIIYIPGTVQNINADGGDSTCETAGTLNLFGTITGTASVNGGDSSVGTPGTAGFVRINNGANVNIISANGGDAGPGSLSNGGGGGVIETYPVSTYNIANFSVDGGAGDTGAGFTSGPAGQINEY